jgi:hypothetical protein
MTYDQLLSSTFSDNEMDMIRKFRAENEADKLGNAPYYSKVGVTLERGTSISCSTPNRRIRNKTKDLK